ncbi:MAG TPA: hypothetical protein VKV26_19550 [Dehalococcoidia bacterium]|nr:hypothetical protein [Dehalococcoidia bacterium]
MTTPVTEGAATAVAGASAATTVAAAAGAPAAVQLPNTGTGHGAPNTSITFMLVAGAISALAGAAMFLLGHRRELEDDGLG